MMSEKVIQLRERLARQLPNWRAFSADLQEKPRSIWSGDDVASVLPGGGLVCGTITELVADIPGSGSATLMAFLLQQAADSNQLLALVDGMDSFDPTVFSNETLSHLLWVRCQNAAQALKAADLVLRDRNLPVVLLDLRLNPPAQLRKISSSVWYRLQRIVESAGTTLLVLSSQPLVGSARVRWHLHNQFRLESLQETQRDLLAQLKIEISRNRLRVEPPDEIAAAG